MTETEFWLKYEDLNDKLYNKWVKGESLIVILIEIRDLLNDYIKDYNFEPTKKLNGAD